MLALTASQGVLLLVAGSVLLLLALGALVLRGRRRSEEIEIPRGMRPGPSDADLETPVLTKLQGWGVLLVAFFVIWVPATWLFEPNTNLTQERDLLTDSIRRGKHSVQNFSEENQAGVGCVRCHGPEMRGALILNTATGTPLQTPNITTVCGGPWTGHPAIYSLNDLYEVLNKGRGIMPSWSIRYAGALDDQQINDIVNYIVSFQDETQVPFEKNVCINPDATRAAVDEFLNGDVTKKPPAANQTSL
ncbi:MAG: c-type cytochrome [Actinomycetota bacterium]